MKRKFLFLLCSLAFVIASADERKRIELVPNQSAPCEVETGVCKLYLSASHTKGRDEVLLSVEVENSSETHRLYLFNRSFSEKDLKKQKPSIRFEKKLYSGSHEIKTCKSEDGDDLILIPASDKRILQFKGKENSVVSIELPLYITKYKKKGFLSSDKYLILQREIIYLEVELRKDDTDVYKRLNEAYEDLLKDLKPQMFCNNPKHNPSLDQQQKPYQEKIKTLEDEISSIKDEYNWKESDSMYKKYKELLNKLNAINLNNYEGDCEKHKIPDPWPPIPHSCRYDNYSPSQVLASLVKIYKRLDNDEIDKTSAKQSANALKQAWTTCPKLKLRMNQDASAKQKCEKYYNSIVNY